MATPSRRIFASAILPHCSPYQHQLDPAANTARRFGGSPPNRFQHAENSGSVHLRYRHAANNRMSVRFERGAPLRTVLGIAPAGFVRGDISLGAFAERWSFHARCSRIRPGEPLGFDWIGPGMSEPPTLSRALAGFCENSTSSMAPSPMYRSIRYVLPRLLVVRSPVANLKIHERLKLPLCLSCLTCK